MENDAWRNEVAFFRSSEQKQTHRMSSFVSCVYMHYRLLTVGGTLFYFFHPKKIGGVGEGKLEREVTLALQFGNVIL